MPDPERIRTFVRIKPAADASPAWTWTASSVSDPAAERGGEFAVDAVLGPEAGNAAVFEAVAADLARQCAEGFNGTVFAYGQTASGKTHTMMGTAADPGLLPATVAALFDAAQRNGGEREFLIRMSYLEIYRESLKDLLDPANSAQLRIGDNAVQGLTEVAVESAEAVMEGVAFGEANRHVGATNMNARSSRSHTVFRLAIESRELADSDSDSDGDGEVSGARTSVLNLIDLAGSERASRSGATGERLQEAQHINRSLMQLGLVISKLSAGDSGHIPYRDSKLTRLLTTSLGGNAHTAVVCTVSPCQADRDETRSTLQFAVRAKRVVNRAHRNEVAGGDAVIASYRREMQALRARLDSEVAEERAEKAALEAKLAKLSRYIILPTDDEQEGDAPPPQLTEYALESMRELDGLHRIAEQQPPAPGEVDDADAEEDETKANEVVALLNQRLHAAQDELRDTREALDHSQRQLRVARELIAQLSAANTNNNTNAARSDGWLWKKGQGRSLGGRHSWKRRWFVLDGTDLVYYARQGDRTPKGRVPLRGADVVQRSSDKHEHLFEVVTDARTVPLRAENAEAMGEWLAACRAKAAPARPPAPRAAPTQSKNDAGVHEMSLRVAMQTGQAETLVIRAADDAEFALEAFEAAHGPVADRAGALREAQQALVDACRLEAADAREQASAAAAAQRAAERDLAAAHPERSQQLAAELAALRERYEAAQRQLDDTLADSKHSSTRLRQAVQESQSRDSLLVSLQKQLREALEAGAAATAEAVEARNKASLAAEMLADAEQKQAEEAQRVAALAGELEGARAELAGRDQALEDKDADVAAAKEELAFFVARKLKPLEEEAHAQRAQLARYAGELEQRDQELQDVLARSATTTERLLEAEAKVARLSEGGSSGSGSASADCARCALGSRRVQQLEALLEAKDEELRLVGGYDDVRDDRDDRDDVGLEDEEPEQMALQPPPPPIQASPREAAPRDVADLVHPADEVADFLEQVGLARLAPTLVRSGYPDLPSLLRVSEPELLAIGVSRGHAYRVLGAIAQHMGQPRLGSPRGGGTGVVDVGDVLTRTAPVETQQQQQQPPRGAGFAATVGRGRTARRAPGSPRYQSPVTVPRLRESAPLARHVEEDDEADQLGAYDAGRGRDDDEEEDDQLAREFQEEMAIAHDERGQLVLRCIFQTYAGVDQGNAGALMSLTKLRKFSRDARLLDRNVVIGDINVFYHRAVAVRTHGGLDGPSFATDGRANTTHRRAMQLSAPLLKPHERAEPVGGATGTGSVPKHHLQLTLGQFKTALIMIATRKYAEMIDRYGSHAQTRNREAAEAAAAEAAYELLFSSHLLPFAIENGLLPNLNDGNPDQEAVASPAVAEVFRQDAKALRGMFEYYILASVRRDLISPSHTSTGLRKMINFAEVLRMLTDFMVVPRLAEMSQLLAIFRDVNNRAIHKRNTGVHTNGPVQDDHLSYGQFCEFLGHVALQAFDHPRAEQRCIALMRWLDQSGGKAKMNKVRHSTVIRFYSRPTAA